MSVRNMFLTRALQKILSEKETKKSQHASLRSACETALEEISAEMKNIEAREGSEAAPQVNADKYFYTFKQACETQTPSIVGTSLDCLQKLIAHGALKGEGTVTDGDGNETSLMDDIVNTICECYLGPTTDADVMLQILKAILTAVTSPNCEVHGQTLLNAIKTCYNIYLSSTSTINITTAKATLTQMLSAVFQRMETHPVEVPPPDEDEEAVNGQNFLTVIQKMSVELEVGIKAVSEDVEESVNASDGSTKAPADTEAAGEPCEPQSESKEVQGDQSESTEVESIQSESTEVQGDQSESKEVRSDQLGGGDADSKAVSDAEDGAAVTETETETVKETLETSEDSTAATANVTTEETKEPDDVTGTKDDVIDDVIDDVVDGLSRQNSNDSGTGEDVEHLVISNTPSLPHDALAPSHAEMQHHATKAMMGAMSEGSTDGTADDAPLALTREDTLDGDKPVFAQVKDEQALKFSHIQQYDAWLVFRGLCHMSLQDASSENTATALDMKSPEARSKVLSLELILVVLQNSGKVFQTHLEFIDLVRKSLCISLSKNGVSPIPQVFELSLAVFLCLLVSFKVHLKAQIEVFFKDIFMLILESPTSSFGHKWMVLNALQRICSNPQTLVDLFLNYDCDLSLDNVISRFINDISRIAQGRHSTELGGTPQQEEAIKYKGLECLVTMLDSMVAWTKRTEDTQQTATDATTSSTTHSGMTTPLVSGSTNNSNTALGVGDMRVHSNNSSGYSLSANALVADDGTTDFEVQRETKKTMEACIELFNEKPKKGLKLAQEKGLVGTTNEDMIKWMKTEERLSKTMIGELLGDGEKSMIELMYVWVDSLDFTGMQFVDALRHFLGGFRLPGEAQKIDRLMEKFAESYTNCNPEEKLFANADTAYVLAFSIIMLTTDLHSGQIKNKMTKEEFIRNNRGINDNKDLPLEFVSGVYDEIEARGIKVKDDRSAKGNAHISSALLADEKKRRALYAAQMTQTSEATQALLADEASKGKLDFTIASKTEHIRPMFSLAWASCLAAFSVPMMTSEDHRIIALCLEGFAHAIRIAAQFYMALERDAFIRSLTQFTNLITTNPHQQHPPLKWKNRESFRTLLSIATTEGDHLQNSWYSLLKSISELELVNVTGPSSLSRQNSVFGGALDYTGMLPNGEDTGHMAEDGTAVNRKGSITTSMGALDNMTFINNMALPESTFATAQEIKMLRAMQQSPHGQQAAPMRMKGDFRPGTVLSLNQPEGLQSRRDVDGISVKRTGSLVDREQSVLVEVDKIYTGTPNLSGDAILDFVTNLCRISLEELNSANPRMYSLQKIVEISYYNMDRIRLEWSRIWKVLGEHFNQVGCLKKLDVAMFAVDSLRQLAMKFLERPELAHFHFQKEFLKPFEFIMAHNANPDMRDMVVRCISQMVSSKAQNIRSGWKNIFVVCSAAAGDDSSAIVTLAFNTTKSVIRTYTDLFVGTAFVDSINCLVEFACNQHFPNIAMEAIDRIHECAERMAQEHSFGDEFDDAAWVSGWFPILFGLHSVMSRTSLDIRTRALTILFEILKSHGKKFRSDNWKEILQILFRLFDDQKLPERKHERIAWLNTTCNHALFAIVELFTLYMDQLEPMLAAFYGTLRWCIDQDNEQIARSATQCLQVLVLSNGHLFTSASWDATANAVKSLFEGSTPRGLVSFNATLQAQHDREGVPKDSQRQGLDFNSIIIKCVVQLEMIQAVENIVLHESGVQAQADFATRQALQMKTSSEPQDKDNKGGAGTAGATAEASTDTDANTGGNADVPTSIQGSNKEELAQDETVEEPQEKDKPEAGMYTYLDPNQLKILLDCLRDSHEFAKGFNNDQRLRTSLWKAGFMKQLPNLLKQETSSLHASLGILFRIYDDVSREEMWTNVESRLYQFGNQIMELFVHLQSDKQRAIWSPVLVLILTKVLGFNDDRFARHVGQYYSNLSEMMALDMRPELRSILRDVFRRIGNQFFIMSQQASENAKA